MDTTIQFNDSPYSQIHRKIHNNLIKPRALLELSTFFKTNPYHEPNNSNTMLEQAKTTKEDNI